MVIRSEQLAQHCNFLDVAYLLKHGDLPNADQKREFVSIIKEAHDGA